MTGGLRIGVSARLAKQALADLGKVDVAEIEELWHGLAPPYRDAVRLAGRQGAEAGENGGQALFRPVMLSNPVEDGDLAKLDPADYAAEWKWDGIRVQVVARAACAGSIRAPATIFQAPFPISSRRWISTPCSTANCWSATRATRPAPSPICSSG